MYNPASLTTSTAGSNNRLSTVWYDRVAVENLKANLPYVAATSRRMLPNKNGRVIQLFTYNLLGANITPGSEGTVGTGITLGDATDTATVNQYFDYMSFSDLLLQTDIDSTLESHAAEMGYRAALTANTLARTVFESATDSATANRINLADNEFLSAATVREAAMRLRASDVRPSANEGMYLGIIHPFASYDLMNDNTDGGVVDILKRTEVGNKELQRGIQGFRVLDLAGVRFIETTTVATSADFPSSGKTGYHTHVIGQDAVISVSLGKTEAAGERNFNLIINNWSPSVSNPVGVIGASIGYNFKYVAMEPPGATNPRLRLIRSETSIT